LIAKLKDVKTSDPFQKTEKKKELASLLAKLNNLKLPNN
jgi:hypothetical protein